LTAAMLRARRGRGETMSLTVIEPATDIAANSGVAHHFSIGVIGALADGDFAPAWDGAFSGSRGGSARARYDVR